MAPHTQVWTHRVLPGHFCPHLRLYEAEFEGSRLTNLVEEIWRQLNVHAAVWLLILTSFMMISTYKKLNPVIFEFCSLAKKEVPCKVGAKESIVAKNISIKKKASS